MLTATPRTPPTLEQILATKRGFLTMLVEDNIRTPKINSRTPDESFMLVKLVPTMGSTDRVAYYDKLEKSVGEDGVVSIKISLDLYDKLVRMRGKNAHNLQVEVPDLNERSDSEAMPNIDDFFG